MVWNKMEKMTTKSRGTRKKEARSENDIFMGRHMGFLRATGTVINGVIGTGIFLSPTGIAKTVGSVGATLIIWLVCGFLTILHGMVYCELGAMMPKAGGEYKFILEAYGPMVAFSTKFTSNMITGPSYFVIYGRVTAQYMLGLAFPNCTVPFIIQQLMTPLLMLTYGYINCRSIYMATKIQTLFSAVKILALVTIIGTGVYLLAAGNVQNLDPSSAFENSRVDPGSLAVAALFGFFAYGGWETLFTLQEEVKKPERMLPVVCISSLLMLTVLYVMTIMSYLSVMTIEEMVSSPAVATTFGQRSLGDAAWIIPLFVWLSSSAYMNVLMLSNSRGMFSMSREGSIPRVFSMLHAEKSTPVAAVVYMVIGGCLYIPAPNIYDVISFNTFVSKFADILGVSTWFYFRWKRPNAKRPFKVPFIIPVIVILFLAAMMVLSFSRSPLLYGLGLAAYLVAFLVFLLDKYLLSRNGNIRAIMDKVTILLQRLLKSVPEYRSDLDEVK